MASRKKSNTGIIAALLLVSAVGGAVMGAYVMTTPEARKVPADLRRDHVSAKPAQKPKALVPKMVGHDVVYEKRDITVPAGQDARVFYVNEFLKELHAKDIGNKSARAIGVDLQDGVAYLDFNRAFDETYGTEDEGILIQGILRTLGQFPDINKVQFEIEGKPMETTGNIDLKTPQDVIRD